MRTLSSAGGRFGTAAIGLVMLAGCPGMAQAEEAQCQWQAPLVNLADLVLTQRSDLPRLQARRFGPEAAYLKIRYSDPDELDIVTLLDQMVSDGAHQAADLRLAWYLKTFGYQTTLAKLGDDAFDILKSSTNLSAIRAVMGAGEDVRLLQRVAEMAPTEQAALTAAIITAIIDTPDEYKGRLVSTALQLDLISLAVGVSASAEDRKAWKTFARTVRQDDAFRAEVRKWHWVPAVMGNPPLRDPEADSEYQTARAQIHEVTIAATLQPETDLLSLYLNQSGGTDVASDVASDFRRAIDTGTISPSGTLDAAWLFIFRDLASHTSTEEVRDILRASSVNIARYGMDQPLDLLDWIIAVDALTPYLTGAVEELPDQPADLSEDFDVQWPRWLELAQRVKAGTDLPNDPPDLGIVAELLFAAREMDELGNLLASTPVSLESVSTASDFVRRFDRLCNAYLWHRGEAMLLLGRPFFKFD